ncbi:MAG TPA: hypothetical protein VGO00_12855 [Kofleriaceae bacterium]|nr:hypothetical protein [Kofleriaceae bacterium]
MPAADPPGSASTGAAGAAADPDPAAAEPEPAAADPEPAAADPEPVIAEPEPAIAEPEPALADPEVVFAGCDFRSQAATKIAIHIDRCMTYSSSTNVPVAVNVASRRFPSITNASS